MYDIETNLELTCQYAEEDGTAYRYNLRAREKEFVVGDLVIYLSPPSTNKTFVQWQGPFLIVEVKSK